MVYLYNLLNVSTFPCDVSHNISKPRLVCLNSRFYSTSPKLPAEFLDLFSADFRQDPAFNIIVSELDKYHNLVSQFSTICNNDYFDFNTVEDGVNNNSDLISRINMLRDNIRHILKEHKFTKNDIDKIFISYPIMKNNEITLELFDCFNNNYKKYIRVLNDYDVVATERFNSDIKQIFYLLYLFNSCKNVFDSEVQNYYHQIPASILSRLISCLKDGKTSNLDLDLSGSNKKVKTKQQLFANVFIRRELNEILMNLYKKFSTNILNSSNDIISEINNYKLRIKEKELLLKELEAKAANEAALAKERAEFKALEDRMNLLRRNLALVFDSKILQLSFDLINSKSKFKKVLAYINNKQKDFNKFMDYNIDYIPKIISSFECIKPVQRIKTFSFDSPFYIELDKIISGSDFKDLSLVDKQRLIEEACIKYEENLFDVNMEHLKDKGLNLQTSVLHDLNFKLVKLINATIQPWRINNYEKLSKEKDLTKIKILLLFIFLSPEFIVNILFSNIINILTEKDDIRKTRFCMEIADKLIKKYKTRNYFKDVKFNFPKELNTIIKKNSNLNSVFLNDSLSFTEEDKGELGGFIVDILIHNFDLLIQTEIWDNNKTHYVLRINPVYISKVYLAVMNTYKLPMISPPLNWSEGHIGGYLSATLRSILDSPISNNYKMRAHSKLSDLQYNTINFLNNQKFVINKDMLKYISDEWMNEISLIFQYYDEESGKYFFYNQLHPDSDKIIELKKNNNLFKKVQAHNAIYFNYYNILSLSTIYSKLDTPFYLPTFLDFRGRIYPIVNFLSYQTGGDLVRSLLQFHGSSSLTKDSLGHVKHYLANVYGNKGIDKLSNDDKNIWFDKNFLEIAKSYIIDRDNFNNEYLSNAKEPFQFISVLITLIAYYVNKGKGIDSFPNIAILFDATCSGSQHLSALCSDLTLAKMVNVLPNDSPSDIYGLAGDYVAKQIESIEDIEIRNSLSRIKIHRNLMKKAVMTSQYNISLSGLSDDLQKNFFKPNFTQDNGKIKVNFVLSDPKYIKDANNNTLIFTGKEFGVLASIIHKSLYDMIPTLRILVNYFNSMLGIINKLNSPVVWISPSGMKINLSPIKFEKRKTKAKFLEKSKPITISVPTKELSKKDLKLSFIANFVHSLDSANIHILIKLLLEYKNDLNNGCKHINLYSIHDCFASSANQIHLIDKLLKEAFIEMYFNENYLEKLHNNLVSQISSYTHIEREIENDNNYNDYIIIDNEKVFIPKLPLTDNWIENKNTLITGLRESKYFIV